MTRKIEVTELALRDAHQSLLATRMTFEDLSPACADIDAAGYWSAECWGGATFDACIRFLNEDPWERLRKFRKLMPNTQTQMLLRGQNLLGYRHYQDQVVERFVERAIANGMNVFRVFDALNDVRNLEVALEAVKRHGGHAQGTVCYTTSPLHDVDVFVEDAKKLVERGVDSICIKDMAALLKPAAAYELFSAVKKACPGIPLHLHVHATTGVTLVSIQKAIEGGADMVDSAIASLSLGPGHNPTQSLVAMLDGSGYTTALDGERLAAIDRHFASVRPKYKEFESRTLVDTKIFDSQIPGGMLSNMENQLKQQGALDKLEEVLEEVPKVRKAAGYPPLVTPTSQIVATQAVFNVLLGSYKQLTLEFASMLLGYYGATIGEKDAELVKRAEERLSKPPIDVRPADLLEPEWEALEAEAQALPGFDGTAEDVLTFAMFPKVAPEFFKTRPEGPKVPYSTAAPLVAAPVAPAAASPTTNGKTTYRITVNGKTHEVAVDRT